MLLKTGWFNSRHSREQTKLREGRLWPEKGRFAMMMVVVVVMMMWIWI
jgi:hypothetical protein